MFDGSLYKYEAVLALSCPLPPLRVRSSVPPSPTRCRPFRVVDSLSKGLRLVWRYDGGGTADANDGADGSGSGAKGTGKGPGDQERGGGEDGGVGTTTGEVDLAAGSPIPWSTAVVVDLGARRGGAVGSKGQGRSPGKVHVHLMEGADRVASYVIDLAPPPTGGAAPTGRRAGAGFFGGWGAGAGASGPSSSTASERGAPSKLRFFFRVDDGGVPSVQSAR